MRTTAQRDPQHLDARADGAAGGRDRRPPTRAVPRISRLAVRRLQAERRDAVAADEQEREADRIATALVPTADVGRPDERRRRLAASSTPTARTHLASAVRRPGPGRPLPSVTRGWFEARLGRSLADVRLHDGPAADAATAALGARAMTHGNHVWLGAGVDDHPNRVLAHELVHTLQQAGGPPPDGVAPAVGRADAGLARDVDPELDVLVVGHASSRYEHPGERTRAQANRELSARRVAAVEALFRTTFNRRYGKRGDPSFVFERVSYLSPEEDHLGPAATAAVGSSVADVAGGGDVRANDPAWRRVDIAVRPRLHITGAARASTTRTVVEDQRTRRWSVKIVMVLSGGEVLGAAVAFGEMKNRRTGQVAPGSFAGGGIAGGLELPIPAVAPNASWSDFTLQAPADFRDLDNELARLTDLSVGVGVAGYSAAYFWIDGMPESVYVGGFVLNEWGIGGASVIGAWGFDRIPPARTSQVAETVETPYAFTTSDTFEHSVYFDTDSAIVDDVNLTQLEVFADTIVAHIVAAEAEHAD